MHNGDGKRQAVNAKIGLWNVDCERELQDGMDAKRIRKVNG